MVNTLSYDPEKIYINLIGFKRKGGLEKQACRGSSGGLAKKGPLRN